jgi:hypothetical protein
MNNNPDLTNTDGINRKDHLLCGSIELTPEAREILTKQINRQIVWGHRFTKSVFYILSCLPLLVSAFFIYVGLNADVQNIDWPRLVALVSLPALTSLVLIKLVKRL